MKILYKGPIVLSHRGMEMYGRTPTESSPHTQSVRIVRYRILLFRWINCAERTLTRSKYRKEERRKETRRKERRKEKKREEKRREKRRKEKRREEKR